MIQTEITKQLTLKIRMIQNVKKRHKIIAITVIEWNSHFFQSMHIGNGPCQQQQARSRSLQTILETASIVWLSAQGLETKIKFGLDPTSVPGPVEKYNASGSVKTYISHANWRYTANVSYLQSTNCHAPCVTDIICFHFFLSKETCKTGNR